MTSDSELLAAFARTGSGDAFAELVRRHVDLVYSAALRQVNGDTHLAQDVAQTVFADLARKAESLSRRDNLTGWLYTSAHFAAAKVVRAETRRRDREDKFMREPDTAAAPDADCEKIRPALDDVMHELADSDREAILLRYFENRPFAEVGVKFGLNENAARMRVERAVEKLRAVFAKRGVTTTTALASVISAGAVQLAPANLVATLTTASIATAGTGTLTLVKIMTATQLKLGLGALLIAGAVTTIVIQNQSREKLRAENEFLAQQVAQMQSKSDNLSNQLAFASETKKAPDDQTAELLKLRGEVGVLQTQANEASQRAQAAEQKLATSLSAKAQFAAHESAAVGALKQLGLAMRMFSSTNNNQFPTNLNQMASALGGKYAIDGVDLFAFEFVNVGAGKAWPSEYVGTP